MAVNVDGSANALSVSVAVNHNPDVKLDMSLQRHAYLWLDGAQAKPANSVLHRSIDVGGIRADLRQLGELIEARIRSGTELKGLSGDYPLRSGRTYRVDNVAANGERPPNHCYPISGSKLWSGVSQQAFAALAALRWLEREMTHVKDSVSKKWASMQHMSNHEQNSNSLYRAMSGARTHYRQTPPATMTKLSEVSGRGDLLKELAKIA